MTESAEDNSSPMRIPHWLDWAAGWSWRLLLVASFFVALLLAVSYVRIAVVPALIAMIVASAMRPATTRLVRWRFPAWLATALPMLFIIGTLVGMFWFVGEQTAAEFSSLEIEQVRGEIDGWLMDEPFNLSATQIEEGEASIRDGLVGGARSWGASRGGLVITVLGGSALAFVLIFLFLKDGPGMWRWAVSRVAPVRRDEVDAAGRAAAETMAAYMRSVLITGFLDALMIGIGLLFLGVPLVLPLMVLTFVAALFPVVGAVVAGLAAATVALITVGPVTALWVVGLTLLVQQVEGNLVMPLLIGRQVAIHPAAILLSLTAGGAVAGLPGAFLAVPVVAGMVSALAAFGSADPAASEGAAPAPDPSTQALPSEALSSEALSSEALPSEALPSEALSSEALPSEALSSEARPADAGG